MTEVHDRAEILAALTAPDGPFPIGTALIDGIELRVHLGAPESVRDVIVTGARWAGRPAVTYEDEQLTWAQQHDLIGRFAAVLVEQYGVGKGDRVAIAMRNYPEWIVAFAAAVSVGAVAVPLNAWWSGPELAYALADCDARVLVADRERASAVQQHRGELPGLRGLIEVRPGDTVRGDAEWSALLAAQRDPLDLTTVPIDADDEVTILYTSGTTGAPKGAVATNRAHVMTMLNLRLHAAVEAQLTQARGEAPPPPPAVPTSLVPGPLFHVSYLPRLMAAAATGVHLVLMYKWDARRAVELIERERVDTVTGVPTVVRQLLDEVERRGSVPPSLRSVITAGAQSTGALIARIRSVLGPGVGSGTGYGMTETCGAMVMIGSHDYFRRPLSVGRPLATSEVRVVGPDGTDVPDGEAGEAWFRGPNVARGYWNRASDAFTADGWLRTGDLVRRDEQGFVYIVDRIKDVVIRGGENVYCAEVEETLGDHPGVEESAVFGVPHELWGEEVVAAVQARPGSAVSADELRDFALGHLARFKVPTRIHIGPEPLPRNAAGKVLKRELREQFHAQTGLR